jgi:hypothetical protein
LEFAKTGQENFRIGAGAIGSVFHAVPNRATLAAKFFAFCAMALPSGATSTSA